MDYLIENASEILKLAGSLALFGLFILFIFLTRTVIISTRLLRKVDDLTDLIMSYIAKPVALMMQAEKKVNQLLKRFK